MRFLKFLPILAVAFFFSAVQAATLQAGPTRSFKTPCQAIAVAHDFDVIEIDNAIYSGDVCRVFPSNLTIRGVGGRPLIDAAGLNAAGKGTWVMEGNNTTVENVEMIGAHVGGHNGAAVRLDGQHLTLRSVYFHNNEEGLLTNNDGVSNIVIENSEFAFNGFGKNGQTHNVYVGDVNSLVWRFNYSHDTKVGHNLKSRAKYNTILYSRFSSTTNQPSYEINLPNGGTSYVIGNVIEQPAANQNYILLSYGEEGPTTLVPNQLYVINNTFLNDATQGIFVKVDSRVTLPAVLQNNIFAGVGQICTQASAILQTNYAALNPAFVDRSNYDLHPAVGAPFIDAGSDAGTNNPTLQYVHVAGSEPRPVVGPLDIGAYEAP